MCMRAAALLALYLLTAQIDSSRRHWLLLLIKFCGKWGAGLSLPVCVNGCRQDGLGASPHKCPRVKRLPMGYSPKRRSLEHRQGTEEEDRSYFVQYQQTSIIFYCNQKYYRHVQNIAREGLQKYYNDPVLLFFKAFGILMEDRVQEAIRELDSIREVPDVSLCALMLLIYAHKKSGTFDREEVSGLESKLKENRRSAGPKALYYAGLLLWLLGRSDKAQEYIDRMLKMSNRSNEGLVLKGWLLLTPEPSLAKCVKYFEEGTQSNKDYLGMIGKLPLIQRCSR
ncbi:hypothetical protein AB205_0107620 [Aquarana catesbeiana]|uniref:Tetratricopeptide repeat protein 21A/21B N-terminal ARM repeat domain-containing protein n=1 Tax=Aquarana catesbeiana TaxID=8400 RepID=A0A2G9S3T3_AQUCT|nr:hypothetical protein AB205_0107620 [Aquarana catesbeiana]